PQYMSNLRAALHPDLGLGDDLAAWLSTIVWSASLLAILLAAWQRPLPAGPTWALCIMTYLLLCPHVSSTEDVALFCVLAGMEAVFQNPYDRRPDHEVYSNELRLTDLAEPLGFDSVWGVEHHFTDYTMCPDVLQFLTYVAGRTRRVQLGSMVVVLPWHDPLRVAEQVSVLDHMSGGRFILGIGRGLGR